MKRTQDSTHVWAVIPAKALTEGKTRLSTVLSPCERARLNREFLEHTLAVTTSTSTLAGVVVVSADPLALALAGEYGAQPLQEGSRRGLNPALTLASEWLAARGASHVMTVSADLPHVGSEDLDAVLTEALLPYSAGSVTVAPDEDGQGTNVMVISPPGMIDYRYGLGSFAQHRTQCLAHGAEFRIVRRPGLIFDVDSPEDLRRWKETMPSDAGHAAEARACAAR